ncbi:hypothetical protein SS05631_b52960 (plasmid) [Sinorhizobium sp. CCBAU 05631]|nr:hypothetical protein SS05631_b52960 [Sinorhizobium sp. CCBAU 05631]
MCACSDNAVLRGQSSVKSGDCAKDKENELAGSRKYRRSLMKVGVGRQ